MGDSWTRIAEPVRSAHATLSTIRAHGELRIEHGRHHLARFLARLLRLPGQSAAADTRLIVTARGGGEHWERTFDGRRFETWQYQSKESELGERFGMLDLRFRLDPAGGSLRYLQREAAFVFGPARLRIPARWAPLVEAREEPAGANRVKTEVRIILPLIGLLIAYDGIIEIENARP